MVTLLYAHHSYVQVGPQVVRGPLKAIANQNDQLFNTFDLFEDIENGPVRVYMSLTGPQVLFIQITERPFALNTHRPRKDRYFVGKGKCELEEMTWVKTNKSWL